jgi:hypothetical protein
VFNRALGRYLDRIVDLIFDHSPPVTPRTMHMHDALIRCINYSQHLPTN